MFKRFDVKLMSNPTCSKPINETNLEDFRYYDKDGFELNRAEQEYYRVMNYPIHYNLLNHTCWQEPWFEVENQNKGLIIDHSMVLHRCSYDGAALDQLKKIKKDIPEAEWLIQTKHKWGFDFALDAVAPDGSIYEVIHIEYDDLNYDRFSNHIILFDYTVRHTDWYDAAKRIWDNRDTWKNLKSFAQNDWKANFLIGWKKAEYTEKTLTL